MILAEMYELYYNKKIEAKELSNEIANLKKCKELLDKDETLGEKEKQLDNIISNLETNLKIANGMARHHLEQINILEEQEGRQLTKEGE